MAKFKGGQLKRGSIALRSLLQIVLPLPVVPARSFVPLLFCAPGVARGQSVLGHASSPLAIAAQASAVRLSIGWSPASSFAKPERDMPRASAAVSCV